MAQGQVKERASLRSAQAGWGLGGLDWAIGAEWGAGPPNKVVAGECRQRAVPRAGDGLVHTDRPAAGANPLLVIEPVSLLSCLSGILSGGHPLNSGVSCL